MNAHQIQLTNALMENPNGTSLDDLREVIEADTLTAIVCAHHRMDLEMMLRCTELEPEAGMEYFNKNFSHKEFQKFAVRSPMTCIASIELVNRMTPETLHTCASLAPYLAFLYLENHKFHTLPEKIRKIAYRTAVNNGVDDLSQRDEPLMKKAKSFAGLAKDHGWLKTIASVLTKPYRDLQEELACY